MFLLLWQSEITPIVFLWPLFACCRQGPEAAEEAIPWPAITMPSSFSEAWISFLKFVVQFYGRLILHRLDPFIFLVHFISYAWSKSSSSRDSSNIEHSSNLLCCFFLVFLVTKRSGSSFLPETSSGGVNIARVATASHCVQDVGLMMWLDWRVWWS